MILLTSLACSALTALAIARYVFPVPAGPIAKTIVCLSIASTYRFWLSVFGRMVRPLLDRMSRVSTSTGRAPDLRRSMATLRWTTSAVTSVPLVISVVSSSKSSPMIAASLADPVTVISLPRTWMSESNSSSITWSSSSRDPSRLTIECGSGITIRSDVAPPACASAGPPGP